MSTDAARTDGAAHADALPIGGFVIHAGVRSDWTVDEVRSLYAMPFNDLLYAAQWVHRRSFDANAIQISMLLSVKTGACPEDCAYCPQSVRYDTGVEAEA